MCEWLLSGEWCDVQMFCGGRAFNAHRAVLASVSSFLRRILMSCPAEETPTYIFLPDFDIEVFSSVLYYIYNGEVVIQKQKLSPFIDIIKELEIFVDNQSLQKIRIGIGDSNLDLCTNREMLSTQNNNVFALSSCSNKNQKYVNLRKGVRHQDTHLQFSLGESDFGDRQTRCKNQSEFWPFLENLQSPYADRQRNSFLRDVYAETYPRNGNANGLKASVLAISNEHYRGPTSVLLTNANVQHPRADNTLSELSTKIADYPFNNDADGHINQIKNRCLVEKIYSHKFLDSVYVPNYIPIFYQKQLITRSTNKKSWPDRPPLETAKLPMLGMHGQQPINLLSQDYSIKNSTLESGPILELSIQKFQESNVDNEKYIDGHKAMDMDIETMNKSGKATISNHVLENPWCPRLPKSYKHFNKIQNVIKQRKEKSSVIVNDSNNNFQLPATASTNNIEKNVLNENEDFKCSICKQVFTSNEDLIEHGRQHSIVGRYACGECGKTFSQLRNFKYHMSVHRGTREFAATCTVCGKYFNDRGYLSSHMKIHRNRKEYKCTLCPKSFNQRVAYNMHVRIHTGVKPHVCEQCGKAFSRKMLLKQHQRTHSGERPYACPHCDKRFADRSNMTLHLRLHTGVKPFSCSLCPKSFTKKHHLKSHLNFHTGAKPYSCPRCKLAFTQSSNMRTHLKKCNAPEQILKAT